MAAGFNSDLNFDRGNGFRRKWAKKKLDKDNYIGVDSNWWVCQ